jgi:hypothetical protein
MFVLRSRSLVTEFEHKTRLWVERDTNVSQMLPGSYSPPCYAAPEACFLLIGCPHNQQALPLDTNDLLLDTGE